MRMIGWDQREELHVWGSGHWMCTDWPMWYPLWNWTSVCRFAMDRKIYKVLTGWRLWKPRVHLAPSCSAWRPVPGFHNSLQCRCSSTSSRWRCLFRPRTRRQQGRISWSADNLDKFTACKCIVIKVLLYIAVNLDMSPLSSSPQWACHNRDLCRCSAFPFSLCSLQACSNGCRRHPIHSNSRLQELHQGYLILSSLAGKYWF